MMVFLKRTATEEQVAIVEALLRTAGFQTKTIPGVNGKTINTISGSLVISEKGRKALAAQILAQEGVDSVHVGEKAGKC